MHARVSGANWPAGSPEEDVDLVVVGGGISGLTTALHLTDRALEVEGGLEVVVLEASDTPGAGKMPG